jgi:mono/diheme cytochrome c family protein
MRPIHFCLGFAIVLVWAAISRATDRPVCPQTIIAPQHQQVLHAQPLVAYPQPIITAPYAYQAAQLVAPAGLAGTVYGYQAEPQPLRANPYQLDPGAMLREAARLTDSSQALTAQSLKVYERFGVDALAITAQNEQLRARAALIDATAPGALPLTQRPAQAQAQSINAGGATICIEPDGSGGFVIRVQPTADAAAGPVPPTPETPAEEPTVNVLPAPPAVTADLPEGVRTLSTRCASCHTGADAKGGLALFADAHTLNAIDEPLAEKILSEALAGRMPPQTNAAGQPIPTLTDRELATLQLLLGRPEE